MSKILDPGDYWITEPSRCRMIITFEGQVLVEQSGGGWSHFSDGVSERWTVEPRKFSSVENERWNDADEAVKRWDDRRDEIEALGLELRKAARATHPGPDDLWDSAPAYDSYNKMAGILLDSGWGRVDG